MKVEGKLLWGWLPDIAAITLALFSSQKFNRHAQDSFSTGSLSYKLYRCTHFC
jgi:hypothetical protein